jgi:hypothetical protein
MRQRLTVLEIDSDLQLTGSNSKFGASWRWNGARVVARWTQGL